jgi:hypothetical protein
LSRRLSGSAADRILPRRSSLERRSLQNWLKVFARRRVRNNNWAWFTAVNRPSAHRALGEVERILSRCGFMLDELKALDAMAAPGLDGWYSDSLKEEVYDYCNF